MEYIIGIDIGTTGVKALLLSENGLIAASESVENPLYTPQPNWAEQDPEDWWKATIAVIQACLEKTGSKSKQPVKIKAIGLTGQMHSTVFLDNNGNVLRPAILWCDQRTESQCRNIVSTIGFNQLIAHTSNNALTGFTAPKILWLRDNEPHAYSKVSKVLLAKDYIRYKLTGSFATDVSDASGTLLFNVAGRRWSEEVLKALEIPSEWLPDCYESIDITGFVTKEASAATGLQQGIPVVGGGGDQAAGAVGNGIVSEGTASCVLGTSGVLFWTLDKHVSDIQARLHSFCHAVPGKWHLMGVTLAAGGSLRWFRDVLCQPEMNEAQQMEADSYDIILEQAASISPGCEGLIFLPYLAGERTPYADANARGSFIGLSLRHTKAHISRAVIEGITMSLKDCLELGIELGIDTNKVVVSGGGAKNHIWRQMIADIFDIEVIRTNVDEGPAFGAAILGAVGAGLYDSVEQACNILVSNRDSCSSVPDTVTKYFSLYELYRPMYGILKDHFKRSADFAPSN